ncbi:MAG: outer membrane protein assembly factor BamA [Myxococcales bacterium]|nr:outer membrane protein assembly factor BamA [Myxococcales bacterium]
MTFTTSRRQAELALSTRKSRVVASVTPSAAPFVSLCVALAVSCLVMTATPQSAAAQGLSLKGNSQQVQKRVLPMIAKIELGGVERVDANAVRAKLRVTVGERLNPALVTADVERIFQMGLFDDVKVGYAMTKAGKVVLRYQLLERPSIAAIELKGNDALANDAVLKVVSLKVNDLFAPADAQDNANKIKELYIEEGYFLATVTPETERLKGNQVRVRFKIEERAEIKVRSIQILGNTGVPDQDIKNVLRTREGSVLSFLGKDGAFKREDLNYDVQIIQYLYLTKGYIQAKVEDPEVSLSADMRYVRVSIRVNEGPKFKVGSVSVKGDSEEDVKKLQKRLKLKKGDVFNYAHVQADGQMLAGAQKLHGYAFATVSNESLPKAKTKLVNWVYHVQKGNKVYFGAIKMIGAQTTRDKVIRRELRFSEGELYSERKMQISKMRVQRLGFFEKVDIKTKPTRNPQVVDVIISVKERTTGTFQVGAGFSSVDNFITTAQISKDNFLGRGQRLSVNASFSSIRTMFQGSFFEPYFLDTNVTFAIELYNFQQLYTDFSRNSLGGSLSWGYRFMPELHLDATYNLENVDTEIGGLSGRTEVPIASLFAGGLTSSVRLTLTWDSRNDRMMPTNGWYAQTSAEFASPYLLSHNIFNRYLGRLRRYFPMPLDGVLKFNLVWGQITAPQGQAVPLFERFFVGGIFNIRGFQRNTLGPAIGVPASGDPGSALSPFNIGGTRQLYLNNELEVPIVKAPVNLRGLLFFDVGNAFGDGQEMSLQNMRMSFGWGVRWFSPVGPLRFEWGIPIDPQPGEESLVFAFTIGNSF